MVFPQSFLLLVMLLHLKFCWIFQQNILDIRSINLLAYVCSWNCHPEKKCSISGSTIYRLDILWKNYMFTLCSIECSISLLSSSSWGSWKKILKRYRYKKKFTNHPRKFTLVHWYSKILCNMHYAILEIIHHNTEDKSIPSKIDLESVFLSPLMRKIICRW